VGDVRLDSRAQRGGVSGLPAAQQQAAVRSVGGAGRVQAWGRISLFE
jgi:hypothetical protein